MSDYVPPAPACALARDLRRHNAWLKARAQYARDKTMRTPLAPQVGPAQSFVHFGPKRKHAAFVKEEEFKCLVEDRAGTPHISQLQADDDVSAQLNVEELSLVGEVAALDTVGRPITTDNPERLDAVVKAS